MLCRDRRREAMLVVRGSRLQWMVGQRLETTRAQVQLGVEAAEVAVMLVHGPPQ